MQAVFIRHKLSSTVEILEDLWSKRKIAVHYANVRSTNPKDYDKAGKNALNRLWKYCDEGAIVGATFRKIKPTKMIVGIIEKGSKVEWTDEYGDEFVYKTVQLKKSIEISFHDYPLLAAIRPRLATVTGWPSAEKYLLAIFGERKIDPTVKSLSPSQLEVICYEYLRAKGILKVLLLPIGRALPDIDIFGLDESGKSIIAQVTHSLDRKKVREKFEQLAEYKTTNSRLFFFGPEACRIDNPSIRYLAIEIVFDTLAFSDKERIYPQLIKRMLKWEKAT